MPPPVPPSPQAYDEHLNMVLGEVEETLTSTETDEETLETIIKVSASLVPSRCPSVEVACLLCRKRSGTWRCCTCAATRSSWSPLPCGQHRRLCVRVCVIGVRMCGLHVMVGGVCVWYMAGGGLPLQRCTC